MRGLILGLAVTWSSFAATVAVLPANAAETVIEAVDPTRMARFADLALTCLHQEYPASVKYGLNSDADVKPPHLLTPAFYGCLDWHSDVHGHWLLVRLSRLYPNAPFAQRARAEIERSLTPENIAVELAFMTQPGRASFERPYGLAWLLKLSAELRQWDDPDAKRWAAALRPLEQEAARKIKLWIPKLHDPIRTGEHNQTAFSFGLIWDWASIAGDNDMKAILTDAANRFYRKDRACPLAYEPGGEDFLSPCLAEADFMRRILPHHVYAGWLSGFLPQIPYRAKKIWLAPAVVTDRSDPKLAHLDGLNLSRAWMLRGIAQALPERDSRIASLKAAADAHARAALPNVTGEYYEGGHWLGTFSVYLISEAGGG